MTIRELIKELEKVSDKNKRVEIHPRDSDTLAGYGIDNIFENDYKVIIWIE